MTIVEQITPVSAIGAAHAAFRREIITLTFEDRRQGHGRRRSDSGTEFGISLPNGTILKGGDCFVLADAKTVVEVREATEPVYVIRPRTPQEWAYYAYHVGNRHQQVMIGTDELIFLQSPAVKSLLEQLHVAFTTDQRPFTAALA
ncbi:MAG TPA: urease accessory protein UreE, partial [Terriglobia bacterium]|nr:urease accessory protein UreE [Terriglobia bacterium]